MPTLESVLVPRWQQCITGRELTGVGLKTSSALSSELRCIWEHGGAWEGVQ